MNFTQKIKEFLNVNADPENAVFQRRLIFTNYKIWGLKTPPLENFVKELIKEGASFEDFKHDSHEEIVMAGMFIGRSKVENQQKLKWLKEWLNYVDNWASCDQIVGRLKGMESEAEFFKDLLNGQQTFTQRFGIIWLMRWNLKKDLVETLKLVMPVENDDYYIKMAKAWTLAEAVLIDYEYTKNIIAGIDDKFLRNKAISKACESFRVKEEQKQELKKLRIK